MSSYSSVTRDDPSVTARESRSSSNSTGWSIQFSRTHVAMADLVSLRLRRLSFFAPAPFNEIGINAWAISRYK
jgi:hypothetical protein